MRSADRLEAVLGDDLLPFSVRPALGDAKDAGDGSVVEFDGRRGLGEIGLSQRQGGEDRGVALKPKGGFGIGVFGLAAGAVGQLGETECIAGGHRGLRFKRRGHARAEWAGSSRVVSAKPWRSSVISTAASSTRSVCKRSIRSTAPFQADGRTADARCNRSHTINTAARPTATTTGILDAGPEPCAGVERCRHESSSFKTNDGLQRVNDILT